MITRRETVLRGLLTIGWSAVPCLCHAQSAGPRSSFGCMLVGDEARRLLAASTGHQLFANGNKEIVVKSGDREFDYALAQTLARLADTFEVLPGFAYYDDGGRPNAYATNAKKLARADGTVLFGAGLLKRLLTAPESPDVAITAVCAHEFAHILQYKRGLHDVIGAKQTVKRVELNADFLAGYFAGTRKSQKSDYPAAVFATTQHGAGDMDVGSPGHHGTPNERAAAIVRGFEVAYRERRPLAEAIQIGLNYVSVL
jgi:hypothetical protein